MSPSEIIVLQLRVGTEPDGFWGPNSIAATQEHLMKLMPQNPIWPKTYQDSLQRFYGDAGDESRLVRISFPYPMTYGGEPVHSTRVHEKCAVSLVAVLNRIKDEYGKNNRIMRHARIYDGCFADRGMRGGSKPSLHARGAAIDLSAETNGNRMHWPTEADMPIEIMECFAREGWLAAGAFWGRDAMHFQATR